MELEVRHLRNLIMIADAGSIRAAAIRLGLAQSALSAQIRRLELHLGVVLLERGTAGTGLTAAGRELVGRGRVIDRQLREAEAAVSAIGSRPEQVVRLHHEFALAGLDEYLTSAGWPHELRRSVGPLEAGARAMGRKEIDLCQGLDNATQPARFPDDAVVVVVVDEPSWVVLPEGHALATASSVSLKDLRDERWLGPKQDDPLYAHLVASCHAAGFTPRIAVASRDSNVLSRLAAEGTYVSMTSPTSSPVPGTVGVPVVPEITLRHTLACRPGSLPEPLFRDVLVWFGHSYLRAAEKRNPRYASYIRAHADRFETLLDLVGGT
ncbi:LysR family transcriptional regulator [Micromonospora mirobrigensis]|uniref:DNA-binding transcriptional regulator, LysR family n=1 Tax=Micromonospora mirobrigensis TaxID=262898 RepID=A0A1C4WZG5_9ACTN|nr:LysR family transcriptional regulator [Micromonospora mirobrigensis]SCF01586.1 DNA-binding transcriptional regulator, LysR family [Micromonospora mirobrigensis]